MTFASDLFEAPLRPGPITRQIEAQQGYLFPWAPVFLGLGIGLYFSLRWEPPVALLWASGSFAILLLCSARFLGVFRLSLLALALFSLGFAWAGARAHWQTAPVLEFRYYGAVEGRVVGLDRSASSALRVTLDQVVLERVAPQRTPKRVRVSLHGPQGFVEVTPGATLILTGHLGPPGGAVEPGGFNFRRQAWFRQLGAVGYTRSPVLLLEPAGQSQKVFRLRMAISRAVQARMPEGIGGFAAAVTAGDRSALDPEIVQVLRDSNLAHLLAISGLHMGLLAGFVFAALRIGLVLLPVTRHDTRIKLWAAVGALMAATLYLALSGGTVATRRAYVMVAVALVAVLFQRRALSLRSVAMAGLIVLFLQPEALLGPGFQMSFAATTALVAVFEALTRLKWTPKGWLGGIWAAFVSSLVAGAATAPFAMAHFNVLASYGLAANLTATPIMGLVVMPMAVLALVLAPLGLAQIGLWGMGLGLHWIVFVANTVSSWDGAVRSIPSPTPGALALLSMGGIMLCLWRGSGRWLGLGFAAFAAVLWVQSDRPQVLIAENGALVGILTAEGRALSRPKGSGFVAEVWLENDGQGLGQEEAAALWPAAQVPRAPRMAFGPWEVVHLQGKRAAEAFGACGPRQILVRSAEVPISGPCVQFGPDRLKREGATALTLRNGALEITSARVHAGQRLWSVPVD